MKIIIAVVLTAIGLPTTAEGQAPPAAPPAWTLLAADAGVNSAAQAEYPWAEIVYSCGFEDGARPPMLRITLGPYYYYRPRPVDFRGSDGVTRTVRGNDPWNSGRWVSTRFFFDSAATDTAVNGGRVTIFATERPGSRVLRSEVAPIPARMLQRIRCDR